MNKKRNIIVSLMAILLCCSLWVSCSTGDGDFYDDMSEQVGGDETDTTKTNDPVNPVDDTAVYMLPEPQYIQLTSTQKSISLGNNAFTLHYLKAVNDADQTGKSFIYSPLSIAYLLSMVDNAAEGETRQEIERTLGFNLGSLDDANEYYKMLIEKLPQTDPNVQLSIANAIFVNNRYTLKPQFQQDMQTYYKALAESLDFSSPATLGHINGWCNEQSHGMIPSILEQVDPDAVSYLLNAVYFKGGWTAKFDSQNTKAETFTCEDGSTREVPLMHQNVMAAYFKTDDYSALKFNYGSGMWNMTIMLPEEGKTTADIIDRLARNGWLEGGPTICHTMGDPVFKSYEVDLKVPRFDTESDTDTSDYTLIDLLKQMGIQKVFNPALAQIPNLCERVNLFIGMMRQKAAIKVNEEGAEASAVTVGGMETSVGPMEYPKTTFHANRPFVYAIQEASSDVILFVGKYTGK